LAGEPSRKQGVHDAGAREGIHKTQRIAGLVNRRRPRPGPRSRKCERAGHEPAHPAFQWSQTLGQRRRAPDDFIKVESELPQRRFPRNSAHVRHATLNSRDPHIPARVEEQLHGIVAGTFKMGLESEKPVVFGA